MSPGSVIFVANPFGHSFESTANRYPAVLKLGLTPSASGSAYLELEPPALVTGSSSAPRPCLKLACTVHGPKPLPRSVPFSPSLVVSTHIKIAPFASWQQDSRLLDALERDLGVHLGTALGGVVIGDKWPKSGVDVTINVLEMEDGGAWGGLDGTDSCSPLIAESWSIMSMLSGCITAASAAITDAGIDSVDLVTGGTAAIVRKRSKDTGAGSSSTYIAHDLYPSEHVEVLAACVVGYLQSRDETTHLWAKTGKTTTKFELDDLINPAIEGAKGSRAVLMAALEERSSPKP